MDEIIELYKEKLQELFQTNGFPDELVFEDAVGDYIHYNIEDVAWSPVDEEELCEADYELL